MTCSSALLKYASFGATFTRKCNLSPLFLQARHNQGGFEQGATNAVKRGVNDTLKTGEDLKNKAASTAEDVFKKTNESSSGMAERAKQVAQNAWESSKGSATVAAAAAAAAAAEGLPSKESVTAVEVDGPRLHSKDAVEIAKRSMNTKKEDNT